MPAAAPPLADLPRCLAAGLGPVVCVGLSAWDQTWQLSSLPQGGGKQRALGFHDGGGGMAANAAVAVARLGGRAAFWGRAGQDPAGRAMVAELAALGVDVSAFRLFEGARSSVSGILVDAEGERCIANFRGAGLPDDPQWLPLHTVTTAAAVLADPRWPAGARVVFERARQAGVITLLDGDVAEAEVFDLLLPRVDVAVFSEPGLTGYTPTCAGTESRLQLALQRGCRVAAVTLGAQGVCWTDGGAVQHQPAFAVPVVDTTGAGDVFHGALALALGAGVVLAEAMRFAAAVAALKCTRPGGREGIPELGTVLNSIHELKEL